MKHITIFSVLLGACILLTGACNSTPWFLGDWTDGSETLSFYSDGTCSVSGEYSSPYTISKGDKGEILVLEKSNRRFLLEKKLNQIIPLFEQESGNALTHGKAFLPVSAPAVPAQPAPAETAEPSQPELAETADGLVYSCAYDGYVVIRDKPSAKGNKLGKFFNGPKGAILISRVSDWSEIEYDGLVGWVSSHYVSSTPTKAVTSGVDGDWLEGVWTEAGYVETLIFNNGKFRHIHQYGASAEGHYYLEGDEIVFVVESTGDEGLWKRGEEERLTIDKAAGTVAIMHKERFASEKEYQQALDEGWDELPWTKDRFLKAKAANR